MISGVSAKDITIGPKTPGGLKKAVESSKSGDTIYLKNGVYIVKDYIEIKNDIKLKGLGSKAVLDGKSKTRILTVTGKKISIENIKFRNGRSDYGAAILTHGANKINVNNCSFTNNQASITGGAVCVMVVANLGDAKLDVKDSNFSKNKAQSKGGAISCRILTVSKSNFKNNKASLGGAIDSVVGLNVSKSTFTKNQASIGGAIYAPKGKIIDSKFTKNIEGKVYNALNGEFSLKNVKITPKDGTKVKK